MSLLIIGSINIDKVNIVKRFPKKGETIESLKTIINHGGKGANQAVAASKLSKSNDHVSLFGKVNNDELGKEEIEYLKNYNINTQFIKFSKMQTGIAQIIFSKEEKDNMIIIDKGANSDFNESDRRELIKSINKHDLILLQLETNKWLINESLLIAKKLNKMTFLNPAPANLFNFDMIKNIDWLLPNKTELEEIAKVTINNNDDIKNACDILINKGLRNIIVTLGKDGLYIYSEDKNMNFFLKAKKVKPVDTTAAGDTFIGSFVSNFRNFEINDLLKFSMAAARITVTREGAQNSIPSFKEVSNEE